MLLGESLIAWQAALARSKCSGISTRSNPARELGQVIAERVGACDVLVALIGKGWLEAKDAQGRRRLDLPDDFVKLEIAEALAHNKLIFPALIEGTPMPTRDALPSEIAALADRNALPISGARFDFDVGRLIAAIDNGFARQWTASPSITAPRRSGIWHFLSDRGTQRTLTFLGTGIAAAVGATWAAYVYFTDKPKTLTTSVSTSQGGIAARGDVRATAAPGGVAVVATGPVTIGVTVEQYEAITRKRERELREESAATSRSDKEKIALLEKQLAAAAEQLKSPEQGLKKYKEVLADASRSLDQLGPKVPAADLDSARQALARGDTAQAERLFENVLGQDKKLAAQAAYQLGQLAVSRIDYSTAAKYFAEAVKHQPKNLKYLDASAYIAYTQGRYADAETLRRQTLEIRKKALGPEHPGVAASLQNLAEVYRVQGLYTKAELLSRQSLAINQKALGPEHPDVGAASTTWRRSTETGSLHQGRAAFSAVARDLEESERP